jgi:hypothetical protein
VNEKWKVECVELELGIWNDLLDASISYSNKGFELFLHVLTVTTGISCPTDPQVLNHYKNAEEFLTII